MTHATRLLAPGAASVQITGTFTGTIQLEASLDGTNYRGIEMIDISSMHGNAPTVATSITAPIILAANIFALAYLRFRASAWSSGTANVTIVTLNG